MTGKRQFKNTLFSYVFSLETGPPVLCVGFFYLPVWYIWWKKGHNFLLDLNSEENELFKEIWRDMLPSTDFYLCTSQYSAQIFKRILDFLCIVDKPTQLSGELDGVMQLWCITALFNKLKPVSWAAITYCSHFQVPPLASHTFWQLKLLPEPLSSRELGGNSCPGLGSRHRNSGCMVSQWSWAGANAHEAIAFITEELWQDCLCHGLDVLQQLLLEV